MIVLILIVLVLVQILILVLHGIVVQISGAVPWSPVAGTRPGARVGGCRGWCRLMIVGLVVLGIHGLPHFLHLVFLLDLLLHLTGLGCSLAGAQTGPVLGEGLEGPGDEVGRGLGGEGGHAEGGLSDTGSGAHHLAGGGGHIARLDRLPACAVGQDAGEDAGGFLGRFKAAIHQDQLGEGVEDRGFLKEHELRAGDQRQEEQQQPHGDDRTEDGQGLDQEGGHPLLGFAAVVERLGRDDRRSDQIEEEHVEDTRDTVQNNDYKVKDDGNRSDPDDNVIRGKSDVEVRVHIVKIINALVLAVEISAAQGIVEGRILVESGILGGPECAHQEDHAVEVRLTVALDGFAYNRGNRTRGGCRLQIYHRFLQGTRDTVIVLIHFDVLAQVAG